MIAYTNLIKFDLKRGHGILNKFNLPQIITILSILALFL